MWILFIICIVCWKIYAVNKKITRPSVAPVATNMSKLLINLIPFPITLIIDIFTWILICIYIEYQVFPHPHVLYLHLFFCMYLTSWPPPRVNYQPLMFHPTSLYVSVSVFVFKIVIEFFVLCWLEPPWQEYLRRHERRNKNKWDCLKKLLLERLGLQVTTTSIYANRKGNRLQRLVGVWLGARWG